MEHPGTAAGGRGVTSAAPPLAAVAALADQLRRRLYEFVRRAQRPITREEAAASVGISRKLAAFHLDKLVEVGLLRAHYEPVGGVRKVGRTPKVYEPSNLEIQLSIPQRLHDLLADILVDAVLSEAGDETARQAALRVARHRGTELGAAERDHVRPGRLGAERALTLAAAVLHRHGFEPHRATPTRLQLSNCPFQPLASKAPDLVCGINHAFWAGFMAGIQAPTVTTELAPRGGRCCVELRSRS